VLIRAALPAALLVPLVTSCGSRTASSCLRKIDGVERVTRSVGNQRFVHFSDGAVVGFVLQRTPDEAARLAPAANGPGDPFAYVAVGRAIVSWRGTMSNPHFRAVTRCFR
jgi:hypothetical protein